jgi:uncharacterized iron-regulated protein
MKAISLTHPIQENRRSGCLLIERLNQNDIEALIDDFVTNPNINYALLTAQGQFLWGDYSSLMTGLVKWKLPTLIT